MLRRRTRVMIFYFLLYFLTDSFGRVLSCLTGMSWNFNTNGGRQGCHGEGDDESLCHKKVDPLCTHREGPQASVTSLCKSCCDYYYAIGEFAYVCIFHNNVPKNFVDPNPIPAPPQLPEEFLFKPIVVPIKKKRKAENHKDEAKFNKVRNILSTDDDKSDGDEKSDSVGAGSGEAAAIPAVTRILEKKQETVILPNGNLGKVAHDHRGDFMDAQDTVTQLWWRRCNLWCSEDKLWQLLDLKNFRKCANTIRKFEGRCKQCKRRIEKNNSFKRPGQDGGQEFTLDDGTILITKSFTALAKYRDAKTKDGKLTYRMCAEYCSSLRGNKAVYKLRDLTNFSKGKADGFRTICRECNRSRLINIYNSRKNRPNKEEKSILIDSEGDVEMQDVSTPIVTPLPVPISSIPAPISSLPIPVPVSVPVSAPAPFPTLPPAPIDHLLQNQSEKIQSELKVITERNEVMLKKISEISSLRKQLEDAKRYSQELENKLKNMF